MKKRLLLMIIVITIIFICGCSNKKNANEMKLGKYVEVETGFAWVELKENNEFEFNRSIATSYWPRGSYSIQNGELILKVSDEEEYKFKIDGEKLVFKSGKYAEGLLDEGAVFQLSDKDK